MNPGSAEPVINSTRLLIYRYEPDQRIDPQIEQKEDGGFQANFPHLPLPPLGNDIKAGQHYVVTEVLFTLPYEKRGPLHWRAFLEPRTGQVLYLRALVACATGV